MNVSVIIPAYNEYRDLANCIQSLLKQKPTPEIIIVDDGSTDDTLKIAKSFSVKFFTQKHSGPALARNLGAKHATGDILVFVDADMYFQSNFISQLVKPIVTKKFNGTFSKEEYVANPENVWSVCWNINRGLPPNRMLPENYPDTQPVFRAILKSEFYRVRGFAATGYNDDWTLSKKLGYGAENAPSAVFYHRNPDNLSEVWIHASWVAKRKYKSTLIALIRVSLPFSVVNGLYYSYANKMPLFFIFKIIYDFAVFISIIETQFTHFLYA